MIATMLGSSADTTRSDAAGTARLIQPLERDGKYVLEFASTVFEVDPLVGGRIVKFALDDQNIIADESVTGDATNWGSTSWPSPQRDWGVPNNWPPPKCIDREPYAASLDANTIVLTSPPPPRSGTEPRLRFVKRFTADLSARAIDVELQLTNEGVARSWAPWQVTRVAANGLSFFPTSRIPVDSRLATTRSLGVTWYRHPDGIPIADSPINGAKLVSDAASSWLAHVAGNLLFVQAFPAVDPADFAPAEGVVEIYASNGGRYVEVETQGPYTWLATGASFSWKMRWYLRAMPAHATARPGEAELVEFVQRLVR